MQHTVPLPCQGKCNIGFAYNKYLYFLLKPIPRKTKPKKNRKVNQVVDSIPHLLNFFNLHGSMLNFMTIPGRAGLNTL